MSKVIVTIESKKLSAPALKTLTEAHLAQMILNSNSVKVAVEYPAIGGPAESPNLPLAESIIKWVGTHVDAESGFLSTYRIWNVNARNLIDFMRTVTDISAEQVDNWIVEAHEEEKLKHDGS